MEIVFTDIGWNDYLRWQAMDKRMIKKINDLLQDISRNGNKGLGKPEALAHDLSGLWSRRINLEHRLVYCIDADKIKVISCYGHYEK